MTEEEKEISEMEVFPLDIIDNGILPRLPAKSLMRFKCVSKPWLAFISNHEFIQRHLSSVLASSTEDLLILTGNDDRLHSYDLAMPDAPALKLPSFGSEPCVVGSLNGLLCIQSWSTHSFTLFNPSTGSYRKMFTYSPPGRCVGLTHGFGYDSNTDDYKVVRIADSYSRLGFLGNLLRRRVCLYSLRTDSFEDINWNGYPDEDSMGSRQYGAVIKNSLLHWHFWNSEQGKHRICCFDICEKKWIQDVPLPDYMIMSSNSHSLQQDEDGLLDLGVLDGKLYLSIKNEVQTAVDIWVMNEYGVKESWVKLFQISDSTVFESLRVSIISYSSVKGRALLRTKNKTEEKVFWYNVKDEAVETAEFYGVLNCTNAALCKGSLVDIPGGSQIRKASDDNDENQEHSN